MESPQTVRLSKNVVHEMMNIIFEMRPSETYVNLVQTLLSDAPETGTDYLVSPELDVLLSPSKRYLRSSREATHSHLPEPVSRNGSKEIDVKSEREDGKPIFDILAPPDLMVPVHHEAVRHREPGSDDNEPLPEPMKPERLQAKSMQPQSQESNKKKRGPAPGIFLDGTGYKSSRAKGYNTLESILRYMEPPEPIDTKPYTQNNSPFHYLSHIDSVWNPRESLLDQNERRTLNKKDFIDSIAYDKAMKNLHPDMDVWAKERRAYDMVWTSGWASQSKEMKGKQVMCENGTGFLKFRTQ